jgi:hypothetical protein
MLKKLIRLTVALGLGGAIAAVMLTGPPPPPG